MSDKKTGYVHYYPPSPNKGDYPSKYKFTLIDTLVELERVLDSSVNLVSVDTETTDLNHLEARMVGFSFCFNKDEGFYVPVMHLSKNIDHPEMAIKIFGG